VSQIDRPLDADRHRSDAGCRRLNGFICENAGDCCVCRENVDLTSPPRFQGLAEILEFRRQAGDQNAVSVKKKSAGQ
jgi:hypothetical protein